MIYFRKLAYTYTPTLPNINTKNNIDPLQQKQRRYALKFEKYFFSIVTYK